MKNITRSILNLISQVQNEPNINQFNKDQYAQQLEEIKDKAKAYEQDVWFYRIVVGVLGLAILLIIVAITILLVLGVTGFDALTAIGSAAVGGLVGLLAPSPVANRS